MLLETCKFYSDQNRHVKNSFLLYDVFQSEGFNLRRDVYILATYAKLVVNVRSIQYNHACTPLQAFWPEMTTRTPLSPTNRLWNLSEPNQEGKKHLLYLIAFYISSCLVSTSSIDLHMVLSSPERLQQIKSGAADDICAYTIRALTSKAK
ncbi:unnamed protein product [Echinostoma caproni]|uniref:Uncharacterized protein n=1 Tax=Echinostoma caproni TaxID=27848 RepID=A0A3P8CS24_9TREM|nr:unnamed protein product [Echinostoma caproni]